MTRYYDDYLGRTVDSSIFRKSEAEILGYDPAQRWAREQPEPAKEEPKAEEPKAEKDRP